MGASTVGGMRAVWVVLVLGCLVGCGAGGGDPYDPQAQRVCRGWGEVVRDARDGVVTDGEVRSSAQDLLDPARRSGLAGLDAAVVDVVSALTAGDAAGISEASERLNVVCLPVLQWLAAG